LKSVPTIFAETVFQSKEPLHVAGVIAFLASEEAAFVNGVVLPVDGGLHASNGQPNFLALM
jgi:meso-butanediol dehydrogenase/(S,S)-butanediol dehydrogenase/diacetyl reductase